MEINKPHKYLKAVEWYFGMTRYQAECFINEANLPTLKNIYQTYLDMFWDGSYDYDNDSDSDEEK